MIFFFSRFDATLELLLSCLEPVVMAEQNFCLVFFKMDSKVSDAPIRHAAAKTKTQKQVNKSLEIFSLRIEIYFYNKSHLNRLNMSSYIMI